MATKIDPKAIQAELKELAGRTTVKVRLNTRLQVASSIRETENGFDIKLNPKRLRNPKKLEEHLTICREAISN